MALFMQAMTGYFNLLRSSVNCERAVPFSSVGKVGSEMDLLAELFEQEKRKTFTPGPQFSHRVMARLGQQASCTKDLWDIVLAIRFPALALAIVGFFVCFGIEMLLPTMPPHGIVESYFEAEIPNSETFLYEPNAIPSSEILEKLILDNDE